MAASGDYDATKGAVEHILPLSNNRHIAYTHNGPVTSRTVVIFFHGLFSVGSAHRIPAPCQELGVHWIAPTLPGMGNSSTRDPSIPYHVTLAKDITALLAYLYPTDDFDTLYLLGGSFGTVPTQMLYGASYELFPPGRKIAASVLVAGFSPLKYHEGYAKDLSWQTWFMIGPPSRQLPCRAIQWLFRGVFGSKVKNLAGAKNFLQQNVVEKIDDEERSRLTEWLESNKLSQDPFVEEMARGIVKCCQNWDGFMEVSDLVHSDWGFNPTELDSEHASKPILVVGSEDDEIGGGANDWLVNNYKSAKLTMFPGGHTSAVYYVDDIWREMISSECRASFSFTIHNTNVRLVVAK